MCKFFVKNIKILRWQLKYCSISVTLRKINLALAVVNLTRTI